MDDKTKKYITALMQPVCDALVNNVCTVYEAIEKQLPQNVPLEQKQKMVEMVLENQVKMLENNFKQLKPDNFEQKLKEEWEKNGTKS